MTERTFCIGVMLCMRQINNVLCYFTKLNAGTKGSLLKTFCNSLYGGELWDLRHSLLTMYAYPGEGVRRIWSLPVDAHCDLLPVMCDSIPLIDTLFSRSAIFIDYCLKSDNRTVCAVATHTRGRMRSPMGISAFKCCMRYGVRMGNISILAW